MRKIKKIEELKKQQEIKVRLAEIKARRRNEASLERGKPELNVKPTILIYCEGKNTEPSYFNKFRIPTITIKSFGEGRNTLSLVKRAKQLNDKFSYDKIWCVFDADPKADNPTQLQNFNEAIKHAERLKFGVAYSNQAFEYWLILHFEDHQGSAMDRADYGDKLNSYLKDYGIYYDFKGVKNIEQDFFNVLNEVIKKDRNGNNVTRAKIAISRAEKIYQNYNHRNPAKEESSTTVFKLVRQLFKYNEF